MDSANISVDMSERDNLKRCRSKAKQNVSVSARRLISSMDRETELEIVKPLMIELENAFTDFLQVDEDFENLVSADEVTDQGIVNGQTIAVYRQTVTKTYQAARSAFLNHRNAQLQVANDVKATPIHQSFKRAVRSLQFLLTEIDNDISTPQPDQQLLKEEINEIEQVLNDGYNKLSELQVILGTEKTKHDQSDIDSLSDAVNMKKKQVNLIVRKSASSSNIVEPSFFTPFSSVSLTNTETLVTSNDTNVQTHSSMYGQSEESSLIGTSLFPAISSSPSSHSSRQYLHVPVSTSRNEYQGQSSYMPLTFGNVGSTTVNWSPDYQQPITTAVNGSISNRQLSNQRQNSTTQEITHIPFNGGSEIKLQKLSLPTFSGMRADWPEFKAVWRELAEHSHNNKTALAHELKRSVHGEAARRIKSVYATKPEAYDIMWQKLEQYYDDTSASVQAALEGLQKLRSVSESDYRGLVELIDEVEITYSQLEELGHLDTLTMRDVDHVISILPNHVRFEWIRKSHDLSPNDKIKPFVKFMSFLDKERQAIVRLAEAQPVKVVDGRRERNRVVQTHLMDTKNDSGKSKVKQFYPCAVTSHIREGVKHQTKDCNEFKKLPVNGKGSRFDMLKQVNACFICFGNHRRDKCPNKVPCVTCKKNDHHSLLCKVKADEDKSVASTGHLKAVTNSHALESTTLALYPIHRTVVAGTGKHASIFCDGGSNTSYVTHKAADRLNAKKLDRYTLDVTTMGNIQKTYGTRQYEIVLQTRTGRKVKVIAYGMDNITGPVSKLDAAVLQQLFPEYDIDTLQRHSSTVDVLLGCDYFGLHPKQELARAGQHLSIIEGELGICLQGAHPSVKEDTQLDNNLARTVHSFTPKVESFYSSTILHSHPEFIRPSLHPVVSKDCNLITNKATSEHLHNFIVGEELATETMPRCGNCKCGKCPTVGHTYAFREEQELHMIQDNLRYDEEKKCWVTSYPWIKDPQTLPNNYFAALSTLHNTEKTLMKDPTWAETYVTQIQDMVDRNVARKLSNEELDNWDGPKFYISHLAVVNPKSLSTPVRIVFNSSQVYQGVSLNSYLAKGPDCYLNNLLGLLLRWREEQVAVVGDIKKMFNSVHLEQKDQHCHRFLWRDLETNRSPDTYIIQRVNMGDTPAPAISCEAVYKTAKMFRDQNPRAAHFLKKSSYVDDLIDSFPDMSDAEQVTADAEQILNNGGFGVKCWQFSGETGARLCDVSRANVAAGTNKVQTLLKGNCDGLRVLGLGWNPKEDVMMFQVTLNFSKKRKGQRTEPNLMKTDLPMAFPAVLTKRIVLEQIMTMYDPLGFLCPFTLLGKIYLRETWERKLGWDDQLQDDLHSKWIHFLTTMFEIEKLQLQRCLHPSNAVGDPWLIIMSDGSNQAYGFAAYILWKLNSGRHWVRLIMAKCRIAPLNRVSTPQMELNGAVLSKRARVIIEKEMRFRFERVLHLVDSETVLNMLNKTSTRFKVYEGVRIGEIQASTNGDMTCWAWISGKMNTADWLTRGRTPSQLGGDSEWWNGPEVLYKPVEDWGLKFGMQQDTILPGEKKVCSTAIVDSQVSLIDYERFSCIDRIIWVIARIQNMLNQRSFRAGASGNITTTHLKKAEEFIVRDIQKGIEDELEKKCKKTGLGGRYARLNPSRDSSRIWVVGQRLQRFNAMTADSDLQRLLPTKHYITRMFMDRAHNRGHRGRNATLALFRQYYWTPHGDKLASSVKKNSQLCKLREPMLQEQEMGMLPEARLKPAPPFTHVMLDLFGPYSVRGEVQKRTTGKAYGVIFTDITMRAVHIEAAFGYDTASFLLALQRFTSIRGWPEIIYSDPGSQLVGADHELKTAWENIDKDVVRRNGAGKGLTWKFGPADSPWRQGAVESLVKSAKRALHFAVHNQRLSLPEFMTLCAEAANLLNERPIGTRPSNGSDINVLTPNSLLLGRATAENPGSSII